MHAPSFSGSGRRAAVFALGAFAATLVAPIAVCAQAPADTTVRVTFGGFVDAYYAWDAGRPPSFDRSFAGGTPFTTQPARHNEFNVNLAFVEAALSGPRVRGRLALQAGTSVQSNYAGEPTIGTVSGPSLARHLQEAYAGYRVADGLWVEGGIFYSHMGMESWASRDNPTYTRSLVAEYSPYYSSGARAVWQASPRVTAHLHVVNGWQNISESNPGKGAGVRLDYAPASSTALSYYNFFTSEAGTRLRTFNGVGARYAAGRVTLLGQLDVGTQKRAGDVGGTSSWYGFTAIVRGQVTPTVALSARAEGYRDEDQVIIGTGTADGGGPNPAFRGFGGSVGIDVQPLPRVLWRTETRGWSNADAVFPDGPDGAPKKAGGFVVSSLALTF
jgi:hypothetical protein